MSICRCAWLTVCILAGLTGATRGLADGALAGGMLLGGRLGGSAALTSDSVYRGLSQTCGKPAAQADLHYRSSSGFTANEIFAGLWGSVGLGDSACGNTKEVNIYGGHSFGLGPDTSATLTYTHYAYPGSGSSEYPRTSHYQYDEISGTWAYRDEVYLTLAFVPDAIRYESDSIERNRSAWAYGVQLHRPLIAGLTASVGLGYDQILDPNGTGYGVWDVGIGYGLGAAQLDVSYFDTATRAVRLFGADRGGRRVAVTVTWRF